ncbi:hypothetical protein [Paenirhodobacter populi]|uniref:Twin-arginine translocation signal domain-containing protein n=1 Tax=Paenirhodobacter populi TaxID=2306993 RepID=A0A443IPU9_9RHOB|nr:hypothetical protein [Sinirhodobacter populi]RWR08502.1 hypothetical protein D2T33_15515 [Sinirhodobacter populi]
MAKAKYSGVSADSQVSRRNLLTAALAAPLAAVPAVAVAETETPVMALFREWTEAKAAENAIVASTDDEAVHDKAWNDRFAVELRLMKEPAQNALDWALKICAWSNFGDGVCQDRFENPALWIEARALVGQAA